MSASLVGSEMCIRDSPRPPPPGGPVGGWSKRPGSLTPAPADSCCVGLAPGPRSSRGPLAARLIA
eukprot:11130189-Alexandrium_andersonii.AAC.1